MDKKHTWNLGYWAIAVMLLLLLQDIWQSATCPVPCDHIPVRSWPLFRARQLMRDVIESLQGAKKS